MGMRRDRDQWEKVVAAFSASRMSVAEFCAGRRIQERTFRWWRWKLSSTKTKTAAVRLLPVTVTTSPTAIATAVESPAIGELVVEAHGIAVRVPLGADPRRAAEFVAELLSRC